MKYEFTFQFQCSVLNKSFIVRTIYDYSLHTQRIFTENWLNSLWCVAYSVLNFFIAGSIIWWVLLKEEWLCFREISINIDMLFTLLLFVYFVYVCPCNVVVICFLLVYPCFIPMLLLYFCLFVDHVNKSIVFVAFVYHFYVKR